MRQVFWTALIATGCAVPLFKYPPYAAATFILVIFWNHLFPSEQPSPEVLLLPTKQPYLAALKPLEDPTPHVGEHCPTCWEELCTDNEPTKLVCSHVYCNPCILEWINSGKNTCPICKKVLFQQPMFQGKELIIQRIQKLRMCLSLTSVLTALIRQLLAFIARHPNGVTLSWSLANPIYYLTGYGGILRTFAAIAAAGGEVAQLGVTVYLIRNNGVEWFKGLGVVGHWALYLPAVWSSGLHLKQELDEVAHFIWIPWRLVGWYWAGKPDGSFLMWGVKASWEVLPKSVGEAAGKATEALVEVTSAWDGDENKII